MLRVGYNTGMQQTFHKLLLGLLLICPVCERGGMYAAPFTMHRHCPQCGVVFERDAGEVTGAMAITLVLFSSISVITGSLLVVLTPISPALVIGFFGIFTIVCGSMFYRHARGLWVSFLYLTGSLFED
jgi:uncharacterized protein (DUF983 family)